MSELKLHLGCGSFALPAPWINIDARYQSGVDKVDNIGILKQYAPRSVAAIYACHCLDHFSRWDYPRVLKRWHQLLIPDGTLRISTVDFSSVVWAWKHGVPTAELIGCLYAAQDYETNCRKMIWDCDSLILDLHEAGFRNVTRYDSELADCSTARIADGRRLLSLNVEANA